MNKCGKFKKKTIIKEYSINESCVQYTIIKTITNTKQPWTQQREQLRSSQRRRWAASTNSCSTDASMDSSYHTADTSQNCRVHLCHIFPCCSV